ncbi:CHAT domain-containing protein [Suillus fuscotomentosus]|uniref:CHAT domain-containing protein n=1 Tax=Suillus fuscotomentosus TaxID=1912939 RepID=A0AAD4DSA5_9AGAM|nr:CHAT domain-containing protein [Suillus fuscotomentosus]KAG1893016.1 CHAT domain-containing protein [Suillus fuscotomentosus]
MEIWASFELRRMDELHHHGDEPLDYGIARDTDAGHAQFAAYITSENVSHLNDAVEHFRLVLDQCSVGHPDYAAALTNLASAHLDGCIRNDLHDIDTTTSHLCNALALRPQRHSDHPSSLYKLALALSLRHNKKGTIADICEATQLCRCPPLYEDLQAAAHQGPAIILNAIKYLYSAIIVPTSGDPHHGNTRSISDDPNGVEDGFNSALADNMARDHAAHRQRTRTRPQTKAPFSNLAVSYCNFHLHAAHPFQTKVDRSVKEQCLEDLYICSYTPTLSSLVRSRQSMKKCVPPSFVVIGQGQLGAGTGKALLTVDSELELVHKLIPATANRTIISGDTATRAGSLEALQQNTWMHLACHGKQDPAQPYNSHFVMRDEHLTLLDIIERDIPRAEFAFLSACHTAVGDEKTRDEVIHLAAGLQFSGFKSVIGTLWEVDDTVPKHVIEAFYTYMFRYLKDGGVMDCTKAAWALDCATW